MDDLPPDDKPEAKGPKLAHVRTPEPLPPSEREVLEGKIIELKETIAQKDLEIADLKKKPVAKPPPEKKKTRWEPI